MAKSIYCYMCKGLKENPERGYCKACTKINNATRKLRKHLPSLPHTGKCRCGNERAPYSNCYCVECLSKRSKAKKVWTTYTPEQKVHRNEMQNNRYVSTRKPPIVRLDPRLIKKGPIVRKPNTIINGIYVLCSRATCNNTKDLLSTGWCKPCHAAYYRERRKYIADAPDNDEQKIKRSVRVLTRNYITAGKLIKKPCEVCNTEKNVEAHHDDYNKPLDVRWLCRKHHREHHTNEKIRT